jgi:predicted alpha/beta-hydrolase family hydrolase
MLRVDGQVPQRQVEVETSFGRAQVLIEEPDGAPSFLLALTHGAGGGVDAPGLLAVRDAALRLGGVVARITQPYRVRGARAPGSVARQDAAWVEIITALRARPLARPAAGEPVPPGAGDPLSPPRDGLLPREDGGLLPLVQGGRSNGARVACRTAVAVDAVAVIALAFPLRPPAGSLSGC